VIRPFVTIGLRPGTWLGPKIGRDVAIGTGAKILGDLTIGDGAQIGANAVVVRDVPAGATVVAIRAQQTAGSEREARSENQ
jgi:serine O-acetyltransferase